MTQSVIRGLFNDDPSSARTVLQRFERPPPALRLGSVNALMCKGFASSSPSLPRA